MDDALTVSRSQTEESQAARMIYSTMGLFRQFIKYVESTFKIVFIYLQHCTASVDLCFSLVASFQGFGLSEWKEQVTGLCVTSSGGGHSLSSGSHILLPSSWGGTGARRKADQASLPTQQAEPLSRGGDLLAASTTSYTSISIPRLECLFNILYLVSKCLL